MRQFESYSGYYDLLYSEKDYLAETQYVTGLIRENNPNAKDLLDLGCGTGRHDNFFADQGFAVQGVDLSSEMLKEATARKQNHVNFLKGDVRTVRLNNRFDGVVSLFHVLSYQTTNQDIQQMFNTIKTHLKPNGIFVVDCWYGPAVLTDRPENRIKRMNSDKISVLRLSEPVMHANRNLVDVNYEIQITDLNTNTTEIIRETHTMRYLFLPELHMFTKQSGLEITDTYEWMSRKEPDYSTWNITVVGKIQKDVN